MTDLEVRIVKLPPMRVAYVRAISETPEREAWEKMRAWAEPKGMFEKREEHPVFGFNNPSPIPESKEYGYELMDKSMRTIQTFILTCFWRILLCTRLSPC
jgi:hypothetical protein